LARRRYFWEKFRSTAVWTFVIVAWAMVLDRLVTLQLLHNVQGYNPLETLVVTFVIAAPVLFLFNSNRVDLDHAKTDLQNARDTADFERLKALNASRAKSTFLANMSHELRTPLNAIIGFADLLKSVSSLEKTGEYSEIISNSGQHLLSLINDILDLAKIESGKLELNETEFDPKDLARECVTLILPRAAAGNVLLSLDFVNSPDAIRADDRLMRQALLNLLSNAVKFTRRSGEVVVSLSTTPLDELRICVSDDGIGIARDDLARVFETFGQGRHDIAIGETGSGLGLPIVRGIIERHGGRIALESTQGQGTRVSLFLPPERVTSQRRVAEAA